MAENIQGGGSMARRKRGMKKHGGTGLVENTIRYIEANECQRPQGLERYLSRPCLVLQGNFDEAYDLYVRATDIFEETLGPLHENVGNLLNNRACLLQELVSTG